MTIKNNINILDCTLRDGGYYNNWDFSRDIVESYLNAISESGVDVIEIGFRYLPKNAFIGGFGYCTDDFLKGLDLPENCNAGVMINASDLIRYEEGQIAAVNKLFSPAQYSPVSFVRIAAYIKDVTLCQDMAKQLKNLGYDVGLNVMQATLGKDDDLKKVGSVVTEWDSLKVLYFADSLGNMQESDVERIINVLGTEWNGQIGIHAHNNMGKALANSLSAIKFGATWVDATVKGMGRGAGNAPLEYLLIEMLNKGIIECNPERLFELATTKFARLQEYYGWGENLFYYLAGLYCIHPTYVQQMLSTERYDCHEIISALETLHESSSSSYSSYSLETAISANYTKGDGTWSAINWAKSKTVMLIAAGDKIGRYVDAINHFIDKNDPVVICLNYTDLLPVEKVTAFASCHPTRIMALSDTYQNLNRPLIAPIQAFSEKIQKDLQLVKILDYGISLGSELSVREHGCTVPKPLVASYTLCLSTIIGAERVLLCGFDGYPSGDSRNNEMNNIFKEIQRMKPGLPIIAVTPTNYNIKQKSIYEPEL
ncbi:hypothetical protein ACFL1N_12850 [Thermodesulfobacteriota bacterium]